MAVLKNNTHKDYVRYAEHCLNGAFGTRSGISQCPTRDGGRMAETSGCCAASAKADYTIKVIVVEYAALRPIKSALIVNGGSAPHMYCNRAQPRSCHGD